MVSDLTNSHPRAPLRAAATQPPAGATSHSANPPRGCRGRGPKEGRGAECQHWGLSTAECRSILVEGASRFLSRSPKLGGAFLAHPLGPSKRVFRAAGRVNRDGLDRRGGQLSLSPDRVSVLFQY